MDYESISRNFSYSISLKFIDLSCTLNESFSHALFVTTCFGLLGNIGSLHHATFETIQYTE